MSTGRSRPFAVSRRDSVFHSGVVRTFRSAVSGRPEGLHYIGVKDAVTRHVEPRVTSGRSNGRAARRPPRAITWSARSAALIVDEWLQKTTPGGDGPPAIRAWHARPEVPRRVPPSLVRKAEAPDGFGDRSCRPLARELLPRPSPNCLVEDPLSTRRAKHANPGGTPLRRKCPMRLSQTLTIVAALFATAAAGQDASPQERAAAI